MADNYLERQREQYEARKAAWEKERRKRKRKVQVKPSDTPKFYSPDKSSSKEIDKNNAQ